MTERTPVIDDFDAIRANMERLRREEGRSGQGTPAQTDTLPDGRPTYEDYYGTYIGCFPVDPEWCPF